MAGKAGWWVRAPALGLVGVGLLLAPVPAARAAEPSRPPPGRSGPVVPQHDGRTHLGVASCASATCHGRAEPLADATVLQNEVTTWERLDKHRLAYDVLGNERSREIAAKLGLEDARTAGICLDCHADNVPAARRGESFRIENGVGCEACHGGAGDWIQIHTIDDGAAGHARNLAAGLYPTEDPKARAVLCLSCHLGDETKYVTHRLMGAGHPRMAFELDLFTAGQPAHFALDDDYRERKRAVSGAQTWAVGQAMALARTLAGVLDPKWGRDGIFPELVFFDCHACHKPMRANRWRERESLGLGPGVVRFNDANLIMLRVVTQVVAPPLGARIAEQGRALHQASRKGQQAWTAAAQNLRRSALQAADALAAATFDEPTLRAVLGALVEEGARGEYIDYVAAYQTTVAIEVIATAMTREGWLGDTERARVERVKNALYAAVKNDERYRPNVHLDALRRLSAVAPAARATTPGQAPAATPPTTAPR